MDQKSSNGTGTDKRNWRERLGIGAKEMPKLSDEFKSSPPLQAAAQAPPEPQPAVTLRPAPRPPQPVTKPAPMAPRAQNARPAPPPDVPPPVPRPRPAEPASQDALAEKLRAQRAAAEKLAEQRVQAARERAEAKAVTPDPVLPMPQRTPPAPAPVAASAATARPAPPPPSRPKFSFAEEEPRKDARAPAEPLPPRPALGGSKPPLTPPRPALGAERGTQPPFLRPAAPLGTRTQAPLRADGQPTYRPIDPATGFTAPPRLQPQPANRAYGTEPPTYGTRPPVRRPSSVDPYSRPPEARPYAGDESLDDPRGNPRLTRPPAGRPRTRPPEDDYEEVFEDEPAAPRQRASAKDYQAVYRETEPAYDEDQRRSSGPWLLLLALLAAALVAAVAVWYYNTKMRTVATLPSATETVPVIAAPAVPAKVAPEMPAETPGQAPALKKKQIYDRIVGDQEVSGDQVVPTEEVPVDPALALPQTGEQAAPAESPALIPVPDAAAGQAPATIDETAPLPLPPPPGNDTQGSLDQPGIEKMAADAIAPEQGATAPPGPGTTTATTDAISPLPPPEKTTDGAVVAPEEASEAAAPPPAKKKATPAKQTTTAKKKPAATSTEALGGEPVVLVAPSQPIPPSQSEDTVSAPVSQQGEAQPVKKKKTLFDLFNGDSTDAGATAPAPAEPTAVAPAPAEETQVAALPQTKTPVAPAAPEESASGGAGYLVQLASFRSEAEAQSEFSRLRSSYPDVVGSLPPRISQASIGGSTRYRLGLGPVSSRDKATQVCNSLFSAGERDCLVRSQ